MSRLVEAKKDSRKRKSSTKNSQHSQSTKNRKKKSTKREGGKKSSQKRQKQNQKIEVKESKGKKIVSAFFNLLFYVVTIGLIVSALLFAFNGNEEKNIMGLQVFNVKTNSMVPRDPEKQKGGFRAGDVIVIKRIPGSEVKEGDIVTFHPNVKSSTYLTHRVVKIVDELNGEKGPYMITQGDANLTEDSPTPVNQVVGKKVAVIPKIGTLFQFVREHIIVTIVFILSLFGSIILLKVYLGNAEESTASSSRKTSKRSNSVRR